MRYVLGMTVAFALSGVATVGVTQALAGADEAHRDSFWANQSVQDPAYAQHGKYLQVEPRDAKASTSSEVNQADASNPYINHSMGTMSGPEAVAQAQTPAATDNGRYTATYQQQYMQIEPRDAKVSGAGAEDKDIYFYHSMGTMAHP